MKTRWLLWIFIVAFVWIVISRFAEIKKLAEILVRGQWQWVLVAVGLQVVYHIVFTGVYASAFDTVGVRSRVLNLLPVQNDPLTIAAVNSNPVMNRVNIIPPGDKKRAEALVVRSMTVFLIDWNDTVYYWRTFKASKVISSVFWMSWQQLSNSSTI